MRYTTVIDISEYRSLYGNINCRLVYLHLALKAGYHDADRDICDCSLRRLESEVGISLSAIRHALAILQRAGLVTKVGGVYEVKKWLLPQNISPRQNSTTGSPLHPHADSRAQQNRNIADLRDLEQRRFDEQLERDRQQREALQRQGKSPFMAYYESLVSKANEGDADAAQLVAKHKKTYDEQCAHFAQLKNSTDINDGV